MGSIGSLAFPSFIDDELMTLPESLALMFWVGEGFWLTPTWERRSVYAYYRRIGKPESGQMIGIGKEVIDPIRVYTDWFIEGTDLTEAVNRLIEQRKSNGIQED